MRQRRWPYTAVKWFATLGVAVLIIDVLYVASVPDVRFLIPLHTCEKNIRSHQDGFAAYCPLDHSQQSYVVFGTAKTLPDDVDVTEEKVVVAAETELRHKMRTSLIFPNIKMAVVLFKNGELTHWTGSERDYQEALAQAKASPTGQLATVFFKNSSTRRF